MAVAFDAVGPSSTGTGTAGTTGITWSHTCSGSNRLLVVGVAFSATDTGVTTAVTYNSVSMTSLGKVHTNNQTGGFVELFYLVAPATGANTVSYTASATGDLGGGSVSFTGVDQTTPVANTATNFGTGTSVTLSVTNASGNMVVDAMASGSDIFSSNQTIRWNQFLNNNGAAGNSAQSTSASTGSVSMGYTIADDWWGTIGTSVQAAAVTPAVTTDSVTNVGGTTATGNGTVVSDGGSTITERGFCWSTSANPTTSDSKVTASGTTGSYSATLTSLSNNTTYHARAYATNANGTTYGNDVAFLVYNVTLSWFRA